MNFEEALAEVWAQVPSPVPDTIQAEVEQLRAALERHHENDFIVRDGVCAVCKEEAPKERPPSPGISAQLDMEDKFPSIREGGEKDG